MDLGVARLQDEAIRLSQAGAFVGSVEYAAPEQFVGGRGPRRTRRPARARPECSTSSRRAASLPRRGRQEGAAQHPRQGAAPAGEVNPQLSPFFEEVVHTLLAKDRDERFASAETSLGVLEEGEEQSDWWKERAKALRVETKQPLRRIRVPRETALYGRDDDLAQAVHALREGRRRATAGAARSRARRASARRVSSTSSWAGCARRGRTSTSSSAPTRPAARRRPPARSRPPTASTSARTTSQETLEQYLQRRRS